MVIANRTYTVVEHRIQSTDMGVTQSWRFVLLCLPDPTMIFQIVVQLLDMPYGQIFQFDIPQRWDDVAVDKPAVVICGGGTNIRFGICFEPCVDPFSDCASVCAGYIQRLRFLEGRLEILFHLCLGFAR